MTNFPTVEFGGGGLGDLIIRLYRQDAHEILDAATLPHNILMMCNNPFAIELFKWHPNRSNFVLFDLHHKWLDFQGPGDKPEEVIRRVYQFLNLPIENRVGTGRSTRKPKFYSIDDLVAENYYVFQPYAGGVNRCVPRELILRLLDAFSALENTVYVVTRSYIRLGGRDHKQIVHQSEEFAYELPPNVIHIPDLSVPATLNLVARSSGFIGAHSSLLLASWLEGIPTAVFYQEGNSDFVEPGKGYSFGALSPNCYHSSFKDVNVKMALSILQSHRPSSCSGLKANVPEKRDSVASGCSIVVSSPMRTGSTLITGSIAIGAGCSGGEAFMSIDQLLSRSNTGGVVKTHDLNYDTFLRYRSLFPNEKVVVCLRNWKDSLISRILYCREIQGENEGILRIRERIFEWRTLSNKEFVKILIANEPEVILDLLRETKRFWMLANCDDPNLVIAVYENLIFNPSEFLKNLLLDLGLRVDESTFRKILDFASPYYSKRTMPDCFAERMTSGHWFDWITEEQSLWLDAAWESF